MRKIPATVLCLALAMPLVGAQAAAQQSSTSGQADPRVGLAAGFRDAGVAARNMELVINLPKPDGFFDPEAPAGRPRAARGGRGARGAGRGGRAQAQPAQGPPAAAQPPRPGSGLSYTNSDIAFSGEHLFMGNYHGFNVYNVEDQYCHIRSGICARQPGFENFSGIVVTIGFQILQSTNQWSGNWDLPQNSPLASARRQKV